MTGRNFALAALAMLVLVSCGQWLWPEPGSGRMVIAGCVLAAVNGVVAAVVNHVSVGREPNVFAARVLLGHGARLVVLVLIVLAVTRVGTANPTRFVMALMIGYVCFMIAEIAGLHRHGGQETPPRA